MNLWQAGLACIVCACTTSAQTSIRVNQTVLSHSGSWVRVDWSGMHEPSAADAVALIMPPHADLQTAVPLKYKWANKSPDHVKTGRGSLEFRLINQRQDMVFKLFRNISWAGNFSAVDVVATSHVISFASYNEPTQGHLALTADPTQMKVLWTTRDSGFPEVRWGSSPGKYSHIAGGVSTTYTRQDMCGEPANSTGYIPPGYTHTATLTKLKPSTQYYYIFGDALYEFSGERSFRTAPAVGSNATLHVLVNADMGHAEADDSMEWEYDRNGRLVSPVGSPEGTFSSIVNVVGENGLEQGASLEVTRRMTALAGQADLAWMNGDLSYARGFGTQWDVFFDQIEELATQVPTMVVVGNHERDWPGTHDRFLDAGYDSGGECGVPTFKRFQMPGSGPHKMWFSLDVGPVHFLQLNTELAFGAGSEQNDFVKADLESVDRQRTPWVVVNGHRPMYPSSMFGQHHGSDLSVAQDLRSAFEELFAVHQVDVTFWGHTHLYERSCPVYQKTCVEPNADGTQKVPLHVILGNAGQWLTIFVNPHQPAWVDAMNIEHGFLNLAVNKTHLHAEMLAWSDGEVMDEWSLTKPEGWRPDPQEQRRWMGSFQADPPKDFVDSIGVNQGIVDEIMGHLLQRVEQHLPDFQRVRNATLVQDLNKPDTLSNTLEALDPVLQELHAESRWEGLSEHASMVANEVLKPLFSLLHNTSQSSRHGQILNRGTLRGECRAGQDPPQDSPHAQQLLVDS